MGPSSDQIERQIVQVRGSLESKVVELRERGGRQVRQATRTALIVAGAGAALGVAVVGAFVVYRLTRPATRGERMRRLLPEGWSLSRRRDAQPRAEKEPPPTRWERIAIRAAQAAGTAAARALAPRLIAAATEALRSRADSRKQP